MSFIRHRRATSPNKFECRNVYSTNHIDVALKEFRLNELAKYPTFTFVKGNIADKELITELFEKYKECQILVLVILGEAYKSVKNDLNSGRIVLFSGTGCQNNGLKKYLGKDYENLYCIDVVCHGVPSPKLWRHSAPRPKERNKFFSDLEKKEFIKMEKKYAADAKIPLKQKVKNILRNALLRKNNGGGQ